MSKICKNCEKNEAVKYSKYTTGEFCCKECARGFSTKLKRDIINEMVSKKLTGTGYGDVINNCPTCKNDFTVDFKRRHREHCSRKCANNNELVRDKIKKSVKAVKTKSILPMTNDEIVKKSELNRISKTNNWNIKNGYKL